MNDWELEQRAFHAAGDENIPEYARELIKDIWKAYCDMERLRAAADRADIGAGWQDIEIAPKDGRWVLTFTPSRVPVFAVMWWSGTKWVDERDDWYVKGPTHWSPLQAPSNVGAEVGTAEAGAEKSADTSKV